MKVMRKDKILEKNHAEYMKAERDILTKIWHPFIIQLRYSFQAMLTDFGMAKQFDEYTRSNSMSGTVEYMSPEIILGKGHNKAADWWSIGILLFEMLTGKPPFIGGNREKIQQKIIKDKIKLPSFLTSDSHSLLKGLLQKEPSKRLGSGPTGSEEVRAINGSSLLTGKNWRRGRSILDSALKLPGNTALLTLTNAGPICQFKILQCPVRMQIAITSTALVM
ncbi:hypothetical protein Vadar_010979 [Vaccinium darrowii]|uniref:Uncharacterized protein n=1 Tax=Vaccinium darrowii TaxID=229202 RepID=A0ACB7ZIV5_9ERIC|nr:hypothetical protein Vadar_010979 [Vaccinium darrowii]